MADVGRWLRTLAPLPKRMFAARAVNEARKRAWRPILPMVVQRWRRLGAARLDRVDTDALQRLGQVLDRAQAPDSQALRAGRMVLAGRDAGTFPPRWPLVDCSPLQVYEAHYLDWLDALVAAGSEHVELAAAALDGWQSHAGNTAVCWEPYPRARRVLACLRAAARLSNAQSPLRTAILTVAAAAAADLRWLVEHHLDGNHLLVDRLALAASEAVFGDPTGALATCTAEFARQLDVDGGHVEASPMYHARLLEDALVVVALWDDKAAALDNLCARATRWLRAVSHLDGTLPAFGDTDPGTLADLPLVRQLMSDESADRSVLASLNGASTWVQRRGDTHVVCHIADPVWPAQPGHAHDDSLSIALAHCGRTVIADAGLSGYEGDPNRAHNRSAAAHSTVEIPGFAGLELWATFRVGARGVVTVRRRGEQDGWRVCVAEHVWPDGRHTHRRLVAIDAAGNVAIADAVRSDRPAIGRLRLHESIRPEPIDGGMRLCWGDANRTTPVHVMTAARLAVHVDRRFPRLGVPAPCAVLSYPVTAEPVWLMLSARRTNEGQVFPFSLFD